MLSEIEKNCLLFYDEYHIYSLNETANGNFPMSTLEFFNEYFAPKYLTGYVKKDIYQRIGNILNPSCMNLL